MILKSIHLKNFRQFMDEKIEFSTDKDRNITLVRGENSSGKTTLANALTWCLFAQAKLEGELINKLIWKNAKLHEILTVEVEIELIHSDKEYKITATQEFKVTSGLTNHINRIQPYGAVNRKITYKEDGIKNEIPNDRIQNVIQEIIPQELSDYFFIKAEQMQDMEEGVSRGNGIHFEKAVKKILGFEAVENSIKHMAEAIRTFQNKIQTGADQKLGKIKEDIDYCESQMLRLSNNISQYQQDIIHHDKEIQDMSERIKEGSDKEQEQKDLDRAKRDFETYNRYLNNSVSNIFDAFSTNLTDYAYQTLLPEVIDNLSNADLSDKDVPDVTSQTIEFLLERNECICGTKLEENNEYWQALVELKNYVPPEFIGGAIARFIDVAKTRQEKTIDLQKEYNDFLEGKRDYIQKIDAAKKIMNDLSASLRNYQSTAEFQNRKENAERQKDEKERYIKKSRNQIDELSKTKIAKNKEYNRLAQQNDVNKIIIKRATFLTDMFRRYRTFNEEQKNILNTILNQKVNEFFSSVFSNDYKININDKYAIKLVDNDGEIVGAGGAQSVSVVLAFITSLLKLSQQIHYGKLKDEDMVQTNSLLRAEPYPLVLDAPFSTFDEERIKSVAPRISNLTEQVIIFTKDPECGILTARIMDKVGKFYCLKSASRNEQNEKEVWSTKVEGGLEC